MAAFAPGMGSHGDMFLKIDGIEGESRDHKHKNEIQLMSFTFGATQAGSSGIGGGAGIGKAQFQDLHVTKYVDKATPKLLEALATGKHTAKVVLVCRKAGGEQHEYLQWTLSEVLISSLQISGSGSEAIPSESLTMNFSKIEVEYKAQDEKGNLTGVVKAGWNLAENKKV